MNAYDEFLVSDLPPPFPSLKYLLYLFCVDFTLHLCLSSSELYIPSVRWCWSSF